jgi:serine protease Do
VAVQTITPTLAAGLRLERDWGVVVADVAPFGPAHAAGIRAGDIVLTVDGHAIPNLPWFAGALLQHPPEEILKVEILRGSERLRFAVAAQVARDPIAQLTELADPIAAHVESLGILGLALDEKLLPLLPGARATGGVVVLAGAQGFGSPDVGLRPGDVIHSVNRTMIDSVAQLSSAVAAVPKGEAVVLRIERAGQFRFLAFELE